MLKYFRVGNIVDDLPFYVKGENLTAKRAIAQVESLCGPLPEKLVNVKEIRAEDVPEGEDPLDADAPAEQ